MKNSNHPCLCVALSQQSPLHLFEECRTQWVMALCSLKWWVGTPWSPPLWSTAHMAMSPSWREGWDGLSTHAHIDTYTRTSVCALFACACVCVPSHASTICTHMYSNGHSMSCVPCHTISSSARCCSTADTSQVLCARTTARCSSACGRRTRQSPHSATRPPARAGWGARPNTPLQPTAAALHRLPSSPAKRTCGASATCRGARAQESRGLPHRYRIGQCRRHPSARPWTQLQESSAAGATAGQCSSHRRQKGREHAPPLGRSRAPSFRLPWQMHIPSI